MKQFLLIATILLKFGEVNAQIGAVKTEGRNAYIYNERGEYSGNSIYLENLNYVSGYNGRYIVVTTSINAKIYDHFGKYTGKSIELYNGYNIPNKEVIDVTDSEILIKDGSYVKYYDFKGNYTGRSNKYRLSDKDGFEVVKWYNNNSPMIGFKDSTIITWTLQGEVRSRAKLKNGLIDGMLDLTKSVSSKGEFNLSNELALLNEYLDVNESVYYIYCYDRNTRTYLRTSKQSVSDKYPKIFFNNGICLMAFTDDSNPNDRLTKNEALRVYKEIIETEFQIAKQKKMDEYSEVLNVIKKTNLDDSLNFLKRLNRIALNPLNENEKIILGDWVFETDKIKSYNSGFRRTYYYDVVEKFNFSPDRKYSFELSMKQYELNSNNQLSLQNENISYSEKGIFEIKNDSLFLYKIDESLKEYEEKLYMYFQSKVQNIDGEFKFDNFVKNYTLTSKKFNPNEFIQDFYLLNRDTNFNYSEALHRAYIQKLESLKSLNSYRSAINYEMKKLTSVSAVLKLKDDKIVKQINLYDLPGKLFSYNDHSDPYSSIGFRPNDRQKVHKRKKVRKIITTSGLVGSLGWIGLRLVENLTVKP